MGQLTNNEGNRAPERVHQIQSPMDRILKNWRHLANQPVESPVGGSGQTGSLGANAHGENLRRVKPGNRTPREAERRIVQHDEHHDQCRCGSYVDVHEVRDTRKSDHHGKGTTEENEAAAKTVNKVPWRNRGQQVGDSVDASHE
jgi:hypothetical protein